MKLFSFLLNEFTGFNSLLFQVREFTEDSIPNHCYSELLKTWKQENIVDENKVIYSSLFHKNFRGF